MALADAILVCLTERDMSGYDLAKQFDTSIGFFWRATHPQIYRELRKLKEKGHVSATEHIQQGKPDKIVYSLTSSGRKALKAWSLAPVDPPSVKDDLLVRLYALGDVDSKALYEQIEIRRRQHDERLQRYVKIKESAYDGRMLTMRQKGKLKALELGMRYENSWVEWCNDALTTLSEDSEVVSLDERRRTRTKG